MTADIDQELLEEVAEMLWPGETRPPGEATKQLAKEVIAFIAKREREKVLREMVEISEAMKDAAQEACYWTNDEDWKDIWLAMLRAFAREKYGLDLRDCCPDCGKPACHCHGDSAA